MKNILIICVFLTSIILAGCQGGSDENYDAFAQCLTKSNAVMYGTEWCPHCNDQKKMFGDSFEHVNYVDCDRRRAACDEAGVASYPTWVIEGESYTGTQPLFRLASLSGCSVAE